MPRPWRPIPKSRRSGLLLLAGLLLFNGCDWGGDEVVALEKELAGARALVESLNYNEARPVYGRIYAELPEADPHWRETAFGYASCLWHMMPPSEENLRQAEAVFGRLSEAAAGTAWGEAARMNLARIQMLRDYPGDEENPEAAIPILRELVERGNGYIRHEALLRLGECHRMDYLNRESIQKALDLYRDWLGKYPEGPLASSLWEQVGWMELLDFGRKREALDAFIKAEHLGLMDPSKKATVLWRICQLAEEVGEFDLAVPYYRKVIREVPTTGRGYESQLALKRIRKTVPGMENLEIPELRIGGGR
ncbi:MAG: tetratricopeptide repeat protein [Oceanipulchritudo sp.]